MAKGEADLGPVLEALKAVMRRAAPDMTVKADDDAGLTLETGWTEKGKPVWFGAVQRKRYVAYHLMPVYTHPALAQGISPELRKRMQGKSCFNFTAVDEAAFAELEALTAEGARLYAGPFR